MGHARVCHLNLRGSWRGDGLGCTDPLRIPYDPVTAPYSRSCRRARHRIPRRNVPDQLLHSRARRLGECVVVDPGQDAAEPLMQFLAQSELEPKAVLLTHGHLDHTCRFIRCASTTESRRTSIPRPVHAHRSGTRHRAVDEPVHRGRRVPGAGRGDRAGRRGRVHRRRHRFSRRPHARAHPGLGGAAHRDRNRGGPAPVALTGDTLFQGSIAVATCPAATTSSCCSRSRGSCWCSTTPPRSCPGTGARARSARNARPTRSSLD
ncbi:MBL fold metallo-hydrolase [Rhodococcus hoagii]|nr:MBL fold metallo-hydrolase [Prescottella equi]